MTPGSPAGNARPGRALPPMNEPVPKMIQAFLHCARCIQEGTAYKRKLEVGITPFGHIQVWCVVHNCNVAVIPLDEDWVHHQDTSCDFCASGKPHPGH